MGSGASSHVTAYSDGDGKSKNIDEKEDKPQRPTIVGRYKKDTRVMPINSDDINEMRQEVVKCRKLLEESETRIKTSEDAKQLMETQMAELEGQNLELQDQVSSLQQQPDISGLTSGGHVDDYSETLHAKDQYIEQIERESQNNQADITKLRKKFKRRLRALNTQISELKQGSSVQMFELQAETQRLQEENRKLMEQVRKTPTGDRQLTDNDHSSDFTDGRTKIILELSAKVSDQDDKIISLEKLLREKEQEITSLKNGMGSKESNNNASETSSTSEKDINSQNTNWPQKYQQNTLSNHNWRTNGNWSSNKGTGDFGSNVSDSKRQKKTNRKFDIEADRSPDHRQSSGMSHDSGIVAVTDPNGNSTNLTPDSDWGDSESDDEDKIRDSKPSSAQSRISALTSECSDTEPTYTELDPASIRRISAAKMRKGSNPVSSASSSKSTDRKIQRTSGKPPPYVSPTGRKLDSEVDNLIQSIDSSGFKDG